MGTGLASIPGRSPSESQPLVAKTVSDARGRDDAQEPFATSKRDYMKKVLVA
jgi:hypothetical protein